MNTKAIILVIASINKNDSNQVNFDIKENNSDYIIKVFVNAKDKYSIIPSIKQQLLTPDDLVDKFVLDQILKEVSEEDEKKSALHRALPNHHSIFAENFMSNQKKIFSFEMELPENLFEIAEAV